jgi:hypothetical protein
MAKESESFKKEEGLKHGVLSPWLAMANGLASNAPSAVTALQLHMVRRLFRKKGF